jgi:uncharacterized protein
MKKLFLFIVTAALTFAARAQNDNRIVIGKIESVYSNILREQRKIWIYTPDISLGNHAPGQRYPVLYLLDGDTHFHAMVGLVQQLSQANGNTVLPEMIIVGITNTDRTRDLTPTHVTSDLPAMDSNFSRTSGGGQNFISFIEKELMPHIDSLYPTAPYKVLVGHSFGGLAVMDVLANHSKLFNACIAIDPSMWYDHERFLAATKKNLSKNKYSGTRLFLGIANTMPEGMTLERMKKDRTPDTRHIRSIFELDHFLKANPQNGLRYASRYYNEDSHVSVPLASEYDGLRFIFDYYRINITGKDFTDSTDAIAGKYKRHYEIVSYEMGYKVSPPQSFISYLGEDAMAKNYFKKAAALFKMNIDNYPNSSNVYNAYADMLAVQKDSIGAVANYKKALAISDDASINSKLNLLQGREIFPVTEQELRKYEGLFNIEGFQVSATLQVKNGVLWAIVPGQADAQLIPVSPDTFTVKHASGYTISFEMEGGKAVSFTSVQPNGIFKAYLRK